MNTNTLQPEYGEVAETFLLAWDAGDYDSIPASVFILEIVERCQELAALRQADQQAQPVAKIEKGAGGYYDIEDLPGTEELLPVGVHMLYLHPPAQPQVREETVTGNQRVIEAAEARTQRWIDLIAKHWKQLPTDMQKESDALAEFDKAKR